MSALVDALEGQIYRWLVLNQPATLQRVREQFREADRGDPHGMTDTPVEQAVRRLIEQRKVRCTAGKLYRSDMPLKPETPRAPRKRPDPRQAKWPWD